ncbi:MAG: D-sedoheptulose-7-phosphate isomerase [Egibacteraceae bacterium]
MSQDLGSAVSDAADAAFRRRSTPVNALASDAESVAYACYDMAMRFHRGGKLIVFGNGGASTDAQHVAVEFVHPVIVGKRALPAISLTSDIATITGVANTQGFAEIFTHQIRHLGSMQDIALGVSPDGNCVSVLRGLEQAREMGLLTIALTGGDGGAIARSPAVDHPFIAQSDDPLVTKEVQVTTYHILWELVHVFFEQPGLLGPEMVR